MVQIKREQRRAVYEYLLNEGVIVVKKVFQAYNFRTSNFLNTPQCQSRTSRSGCCLDHSRIRVSLMLSSHGSSTTTTWRMRAFNTWEINWVFSILNSTGIAEQVVPATFKKSDKVHEIEAEGGSKPRGRGAGRGRGSGVNKVKYILGTWIRKRKKNRGRWKTSRRGTTLGAVIRVSKSRNSNIMYI